MCVALFLYFIYIVLHSLYHKTRLFHSHIYVTAGWGTGVASSSLAIILGCLVSDVKQASEFGPLLFVPQILFAGFFIKNSQIPIWLRW